MGLFAKDQGGSGADLSKLYLENLAAMAASAAASKDEEKMTRVVRLYVSIPSSLPDKDVFLAEAVKWSSDKQYPSGHPRLHQLLAYEFWKLKRCTQSYFFVSSSMSPTL